ncbi:MAG TPA: hypothetical protein VNI52_14510 [Sphingobacteriaceae bacterium]|nr:hypothetical protein [Sphingobacteriaceae bacterium]
MDYLQEINMNENQIAELKKLYDVKTNKELIAELHKPAEWAKIPNGMSRSYRDWTRICIMYPA